MYVNTQTIWCPCNSVVDISDQNDFISIQRNSAQVNMASGTYPTKSGLLQNLNVIFVAVKK